MTAQLLEMQFWAGLLVCAVPMLVAAALNVTMHSWIVLNTALSASLVLHVHSIVDIYSDWDFKAPTLGLFVTHVLLMILGSVAMALTNSIGRPSDSPYRPKRTLAFSTTAEPQASYIPHLRRLLSFVGLCIVLYVMHAFTFLRNVHEIFHRSYGIPFLHLTFIVLITLLPPLLVVGAAVYVIIPEIRWIVVRLR